MGKMPREFYGQLELCVYVCVPHPLCVPIVYDGKPNEISGRGCIALSIYE